MIAVISIAITFWLFYYFFIKGNAWPVVFLVFGIWGGKSFFISNFPSTAQTVMTFMSYQISWASFLSAIICILALGVVMEKVS